MSEELTRVAVTWNHSGDAEFPYTAEVGGRRYTLRLNDFPAEPLYTLMCEGAELEDLEDLPAGWEVPAPPQALLALLAPQGGPRCTGAVRFVETSAPGGEPAAPPGGVELALDVSARERILAIAPERGLAVTTFASEGGHGARLRDLRSSRKRDLAVGQPPIVAGALAPDGLSVLVLDEEGHVLRYDLATGGFPATAAARKPSPGRGACLAVARDGRLWLVASGGAIEVRRMHDAAPLATVDLSSVAEYVTGLQFLPDERGFLARTSRGLTHRFELLVDRVGASREARVAAIAEAVDAAIAGTGWERYASRVEIYDERSAPSGETTLSFVADHHEYHHAQSGSDWAEHVLCAGHATFDGARCVEVRVTAPDARRISEYDHETYDRAAEFAAFRAEVARGSGS